MENLEQNEVVQNEPVQVKSPHIVWAVIITAIVVAVLVGGGVYILQLQRIKSLEKQLSQVNQKNVFKNQSPSLTIDTKTQQQATTSITSQPTKSSSTTTDDKQVKVADKAGFYSISIPSDWKITKNEGAMGAQLSRILITSPSWSYYEDKNFDGPFTPQYYKSGGKFTLQVTKGDASGSVTGNTKEKAVTIGGVASKYYIVKGISTMEGQTIESSVNYNGNNYFFRLDYNPTNFDGENIFNKLLNSFKFSQ